MDDLQQFITLCNKQNGVLRVTDQNKYLPVNELQPLISKISPQVQELITTHQPEELLEYEGRNLYAYPLGHQNVLEPVVQTWDSRNPHFNALYFFRSVRLYLAKGADNYRLELLREARLTVHRSMRYYRSRIQKTATNITTLRQLRSQVARGKTFIEGDFSFHIDQYMLSDHYQAMIKTNLMHFFSQHPTIPHASPEIARFSNAKVLLDRDGNTASIDDLYGHSGASFAFVYHQMQTIAQRGWEPYVTAYLETRFEELETLETHVAPILEYVDVMQPCDSPGA
jgi:hypothetical protein